MLFLINFLRITTIKRLGYEKLINDAKRRKISQNQRGHRGTNRGQRRLI